ncbi:hypothetical protein JD276_15275 [Leucobacter sp. CSA1]|uniref:Uncharacterized protein n=1 Tax=Leucobacter chromiisoli TaxID=2796471 RepID=A0A934Q8X3_9MICO|nr:hypothetical protein [Leucobacter chromiisoli]MBK0420389.1 hypothetical protein [Leucobacter chromiisoli]
MSNREIITRVYREAVMSYGDDGVDRPEAIESALATLMVEVRAGRLEVDVERALRSELQKADEADGRSADAILQRAAYGEVPLLAEDLDVIVTLGGGRRKAWCDVTPLDLKQMNDIRFENYRKVKRSYLDFNAAYMKVRDVVLQHQTFGAAWKAGGFPPAEASEAVA